MPQDDDLHQTLDLKGGNKAAIPKWNVVYVHIVNLKKNRHSPVFYFNNNNII